MLLRNLYPIVNCIARYLKLFGRSLEIATMPEMFNRCGFGGWLDWDEGHEEASLLPNGTAPAGDRQEATVGY